MAEKKTTRKPKNGHIIQESIPGHGLMPYLTLKGTEAETAEGIAVGKRDFSLGLASHRASDLGDLKQLEIIYIGPLSDIPIPEVGRILSDREDSSVVWVMNPNQLTMVENGVRTWVLGTEIITAFDPEHGLIRPCLYKNDALIKRAKTLYGQSVPHDFSSMGNEIYH